MFRWCTNEFKCYLTETNLISVKSSLSSHVRISYLHISRWSVARAFPPGRFLNLILAHREEICIFNEARHQNILIGGKFSLNFYSCKGIFDYSRKYDDINDTYFSNNTKNLKSSVQNGTGTFVIEKQYLQWEPHVNRIKWRRVTSNQRNSNFPPHDHIWSKLGVFKREDNDCIRNGEKRNLHKIKNVVFLIPHVVLWSVLLHEYVIMTS